MQTKITQKTAVEIFLGILLFLAVIAVVVAAWAGANTPEPDLFEGFVTDGEGTRYYDTGVYRTGWQVIDGAHYYFRLETGYMVTGVLSIRGEKFAFREDGTQIRDGFVRDTEGTLYFDGGRHVTGWQEIDGNRYYFFLDSGYMATGTVKISGVTCTFSPDGVLLSEGQP